MFQPCGIELYWLVMDLFEQLIQISIGIGEIEGANEIGLWGERRGIERKGKGEEE